MKENNLDTESWIIEFKKGTGRSFDDVFDRYYVPLCYFAEKIISDGQEAKDIVADSFAKLWRKRQDFEKLQSIQSFMYTVTRNACLDFLKHNHRKILSHKELQYLSQEDGEDDFLNDMIEAEVLQKIIVQIDNLPKKCRTIFKMIFFERLSTDDIAGKLNISKRNVLNQKTRAIQLLKAVFLKKDLLMVLICLDIFKNGTPFT